MSTDLPQSVTRIDGPGGLPLLHITNSHATVEVFLDGAHVSGYGPAGHRDVLFFSRESGFDQGTPLRGGIPLCAPWFGPGVNGDRAPAHGFFRNVRWEVTDAQEQDGVTSVTLTLPPAALAQLEAAAGWPADAVAQLRVEVGPALTVELTVTAGKEPLEVETALHSYYGVADVRRIKVTGLEGAQYFDKLSGQTATQDGPVTITAETDRVYTSTGTVVLDDPQLRRRITVGKAGSANTVVWNPWVAKAASLKDLADDEWPMFICLEAANCLDDRLRLEPGQSHSTATIISAAHL